ncbi:hypothetical protein [Hyphomonas oceanitis]|uniref:Uncharacterized protein n=1 Tax=Hyphomonas oceanitis SCH89 TaxID=1280953 RepID=A0A059GBM3_9PROT|nr:hypothetical protein [Hyphomonas oceanitis]KDA04221.1 hypothetical protein HOC_00010 [Hyphomonas oceanitis SCH89]
MPRKRKKQVGEARPSDWHQLGTTLWRRFATPFGNPTYVSFFLVSMGMGAIGIWVAMAQTFSAPNAEFGPTPLLASPNVYQSILTFFAAVGSVSCVQLLITEDTNKHLRSFAVLMLLMFFSSAVLCAYLNSQDFAFDRTLLLVSTTLAVVIWWIANWEDGKFDQPNADVSLGGSTDEEAAGDLGEFVV